MCWVITELRPRWVLGENAAGFINMGLDKTIFDVQKRDTLFSHSYFRLAASAHGIAYGGNKVRSAVREHRMKPWRDAVKAERVSIKANADFLYQKALHDDPALAASNPVSRYLQKKRIQRNYAKQIRQAEKTAKNTAATAQSAAKHT